MFSGDYKDTGRQAFSGGFDQPPPLLAPNNQRQQPLQQQQQQQGYYAAGPSPASYQQHWAPAPPQFAQYPMHSTYHPHNGAAFYPGPNDHPNAAAVAMQRAPGGGYHHHAMAAPPPHQAYGSMPLDSIAQQQSRGWGGMHLSADQQARSVGGGGYNNVNRGGVRGGGYGGGGGGRGYGDYSRGRGRGRGNCYGGNNNNTRGGRGGGRFSSSYRNNNNSNNTSNPAIVEELLWKIKQIPRDTPLDTHFITDILNQLDSRGVSSLIKDLGRAGLAHRGKQLFEHLRNVEASHEHAALLDEFTYTSMISNCVGQRSVQQALDLSQEMASRGIQRNVHTFSALMNVCIKSGEYQLALDVYQEMRDNNCPANVVTYNTLIDVFGKSSMWEEALDVLIQMRSEGVQPVTRTFNTLMIACNTSGQWQEALRVYEDMRSEGHEPNTTTYNALISAYSKAGDLPKVLSVFKEMVQRGCERSVITYSALISACEKAGEWKLAIQLFGEMRQEGCVPNVISYNSLITACAQGAQWEKAREVLSQMQRQGCSPDVVTYTAMIQAYERGGQWRRALEAFEEMNAAGCTPDSIVYSTIIDVLWETGVAWAQHKALALFREASEKGLTRKFSHAAGESLELNLHSTTAGIALLSLYCWLEELTVMAAAGGFSALALKEGGGEGKETQQTAPEATTKSEEKQQQDDENNTGRAAGLPSRITIVAGKGKARDAPHSIIKESITNLLRTLRSPFEESSDSTPFIGRLEATGEKVAEWLMQYNATILDSIVPPMIASSTSNTAKGVASGRASLESTRSTAADDQQSTVLQVEVATEGRVSEAFNTVKFFEETHCLDLQAMPYTYLQKRAELFEFAASVARRLNLPDEAVYDGVLLLDRTMSRPLQLEEPMWPVTLAACVYIGAQQSGLPGALNPTLSDVASVTQLSVELLEAAHNDVQTVLTSDTASISALRCLKLYQERLGADTVSGIVVHVAVTEGGLSGGGYQSQRSSLDVVDRVSVVSAATGDFELQLQGNSIGSGNTTNTKSLLRLLHEALINADFLNYRPSVVAAGVLYVDRKFRGCVPYWPSVLSSLTGYSLASSPELAAAIAGVQRLYEKLQVPPAVWNYQPSSGQPTTAPTDPTISSSLP